MAVRIQRKRTKGWRMPKGAVYVGRPARWGNPFRVADGYELGLALEDYVGWLHRRVSDDPDFLTPLRGKDLACWCKVTDICHADILLELANQ